jgi:glycosyltransferase involved in cell wall biosynthesis
MSRPGNLSHSAVKARPMLDQITPLLLTLDEECNISRSVQWLSWAREVIIVDSFSTDGTVEMAERFPNVRVVRNKFCSHSQQWDFGLKETGIRTEWILALDADFILTEAVIKEIEDLRPADDVAGYRASFKYCIEGKVLKGALYPPVTVLFRRSLGQYVQDGHTQRLQLKGKVLDLISPILHDDRKPLHRWLTSQIRYMRLESTKLLASNFSALSVQDKVRRCIVIAPIAAFVYCMIFKRNIFDGRAGLFYALQRSSAELLLSLYLLDAIIRRATR